jgi:hypothetical protein|tara:strand:- start:1807 stop:2019 length:213 start_codon:yes stop_codon:yes gene_type:complete
MRVRISRTVKRNGQTIAYTVKVKGKKFPKGCREFYFPKDLKPTTAIEMALMDYKKLQLENKEIQQNDLRN